MIQKYTKKILSTRRRLRKVKEVSYNVGATCAVHTHMVAGFVVAPVVELVRSNVDVAKAVYAPDCEEDLETYSRMDDADAEEEEAAEKLAEGLRNGRGRRRTPAKADVSPV